MATTTTAQICDAIESTLGAASGVSTHQSYDEMTEGVHAMPLLQVYWESTEEDISGSTDRTTFGGGRRQDEHLFHADLFCRQRSVLAEDMKKLIEMKDAMDAVLAAQDDKPYFGLAGIQAFHWRAERVTFVYGDSQIPYVGIRYHITIRTF